jgi:hypothetical protein
MMSFSSFSQIGTTPRPDSAIIVSKTIAGKIVKDLIKGDECDSLLKVTQDNEILYKEEISLKDSVIYSQDTTISLLRDNIHGYQVMDDFQKEYMDIIEAENSDYKRTNFFLTLGLIVLGTLTLFK